MVINKLRRRYIFFLLLSICLVFIFNFCGLQYIFQEKYDHIKDSQKEYVLKLNKYLGDESVNYSNPYNNVVFSIKNQTNYSDLQNIPYDGSSLKQLNDKTFQGLDLNGIIRNNEKEKILGKLEGRVNDDSYRNKLLSPYYIFSFDDAMNLLQYLDAKINLVADAQKVPKPLLSAVLFREMMFIGQEDMLDGLPYIGGKSIGICQIGVENVRSNESVVHGSKSLIAKQSDKEIIEELQDVQQAVYFCAVQLRTRAINLTHNKDIDLNNLDDKQLQQILEAYNQSPVAITVGPIKTKQKYGQETLYYYKLFKQYYGLVN